MQIFENGRGSLEAMEARRSNRAANRALRMASSSAPASTSSLRAGLGNTERPRYALPDDGYGFFQLMFLLAVYGCILFYAANMIGDGSELLLLIPSIAGIVGSCILPVLG